MSIWDWFHPKPQPPQPPPNPTCGVAAVVTSAGSPLPDANVLVGAQYGQTNGDGYIFFGGVPKGPVVTVHVSKAGYAPYEGDYAFGADNQDLPIGLTALAPQPVLPPPPSRAQVCALQTSLQGLTYPTVQYKDIPAWFYAKLTPEDRARARAAHRGAVVPGRSGGDTHIPVGISEAYKEPGTLWPDDLKEGYDFAYDLVAFRAILSEAIADGFLIDLPLAGDGLSKSVNPGPGEYNDPVGSTYGFEWLMANFERIAAVLAGDGTDAMPDLTKYILFRPGWDGVFYGWSPEGGETPDLQPDRVRRFGELFRAVLPDGYLAIEHTPGNIPCGEGGGDYAPGGLMAAYDTILSEYSTVHEDSCWQVVGRMVKPYHRPADQTPGDDPNPPFYLVDSARGPRFYVGFEPTTGGVYEWCRGRCTLAQVNEVRSYLVSLGVKYVG